MASSVSKDITRRVDGGVDIVPRGVSIGTICAQLRAIMTKTGTRRQPFARCGEWCPSKASARSVRSRSS